MHSLSGTRNLAGNLVLSKGVLDQWYLFVSQVLFVKNIGNITFSLVKLSYDLVGIFSRS